MKLKTIILSAIAVLGMATPAFAKGKKTANSADNNVSPTTEQVAEHDIRSMAPTTPTATSSTV